VLSPLSIQLANTQLPTLVNTKPVNTRLVNIMPSPRSQDKRRRVASRSMVSTRSVMVVDMAADVTLPDIVVADTVVAADVTVADMAADMAADITVVVADVTVIVVEVEDITVAEDTINVTVANTTVANTTVANITVASITVASTTVARRHTSLSPTVVPALATTLLMLPITPLPSYIPSELPLLHSKQEHNHIHLITKSMQKISILFS